MLKLTYCLARRPEMSRAAFQDYWLNTHGPLVRAAQEALNIRRYVQAHTVASPLAEATAAARGIPLGDNLGDYDGVAELWFEDDDALAPAEPNAEAQRHGAILAEDEAKFIDFARSRIFFTREEEIIG